MLTADISDPSAAPEGKDTIVILIPVGHLLPSSSTDKIRTFKEGSSVPDTESQDWPALVERARQQVIDIMEKRLGIEDLRSHITWEGVNTPLTCKSTLHPHSFAALSGMLRRLIVIDSG